MDITLFTSQGITPYRAEWVEYNSNPRNSFRYRIKFLYFIYSDVTLNMTARFQVERYIQQNGVWGLDISYSFDSVADNFTYVDKDGNIVSSDDPAKWGTEFDRMAVLFAAPVPDNQILEGYMDELFGKGLFDFPKNREI